MNNVLLITMLVVTVCAPGVCPQRDVYTPATTDWPTWASPEWVTYASHIIASEARGVPSAYGFVASQLVCDINRGYHPFGLHGQRWHGWSDAVNSEIVDSVKDVLDGDTPGVCCVYVGNMNDYRHNWTHLRPDFVFASEDNRNAVIGVQCKEEE